MPNVTTYIRKDDMELWLACPNKAQLIHDALTDPDKLTDPMTPPKTTEQIFNLKPEPLVSNVEKFVPRAPDPETGYPCCTKNRPCKHWIWDGNVSAYVNSLTGKLREAAI